MRELLNLSPRLNSDFKWIALGVLGGEVTLNLINYLSPDITKALLAYVGIFGIGVTLSLIDRLRNPDEERTFFPTSLGILAAGIGVAAQKILPIHEGGTFIIPTMFHAAGLLGTIAGGMGVHEILQSILNPE